MSDTPPLRRAGNAGSIPSGGLGPITRGGLKVTARSRSRGNRPPPPVRRGRVGCPLDIARLPQLIAPPWLVCYGAPRIALGKPGESRGRKATGLPPRQRGEDGWAADLGSRSRITIPDHGAAASVLCVRSGPWRVTRPGHQAVAHRPGRGHPMGQAIDHARGSMWSRPCRKAACNRLAAGLHRLHAAVQFCTPGRQLGRPPPGRPPGIVRCLGLVAAIWLLGEGRPIAVVQPADAVLPPASVLRPVIQLGDRLPAISQPTVVPLDHLGPGNELPDSAGLPAEMPDSAGLSNEWPLGLASGASPLARHADPPAEPGAPPAAAPLVAVALRYVGAPYRYGGADPSGFDCSGFVFFVSREAGRPLPRTIAEQSAAGPPLAASALQAGDLVFFADTYTEGLSHSGIYVGGGQFVHAGTEATGVVVSALANPYWASHWHGAVRIV
jgi:peptidoglycan DL-endopeptidase CwlO